MKAELPFFLKLDKFLNTTYTKKMNHKAFNQNKNKNLRSMKNKDKNQLFYHLL